MYYDPELAAEAYALVHSPELQHGRCFRIFRPDGSCATFTIGKNGPFAGHALLIGLDKRFWYTRACSTLAWEMAEILFDVNDG